MLKFTTTNLKNHIKARLKAGIRSPPPISWSTARGSIDVSDRNRLSPVDYRNRTHSQEYIQGYNTMDEVHQAKMFQMAYEEAKQNVEKRISDEKKSADKLESKLELASTPKSLPEAQYKSALKSARHKLLQLKLKEKNSEASDEDPSFLTGIRTESKVHTDKMIYSLKSYGPNYKLASRSSKKQLHFFDRHSKLAHLHKEQKLSTDEGGTNMMSQLELGIPHSEILEKISKRKKRIRKKKLVTDGQTDGRMDGQTDGRTD